MFTSKQTNDIFGNLEQILSRKPSPQLVKLLKFVNEEELPVKVLTSPKKMKVKEIPKIALTKYDTFSDLLVNLMKETDMTMTQLHNKTGVAMATIRSTLRNETTVLSTRYNLLNKFPLTTEQKARFACLPPNEILSLDEDLSTFGRVYYLLRCAQGVTARDLVRDFKLPKRTLYDAHENKPLRLATRYSLLNVLPLTDNQKAVVAKLNPVFSEPEHSDYFTFSGAFYFLSARAGIAPAELGRKLEMTPNEIYTSFRQSPYTLESRHFLLGALPLTRNQREKVALLP